MNQMLRENRASIDSGILGWIFPALRDSSLWLGTEGTEKTPNSPANRRRDGTDCRTQVRMTWRRLGSEMRQGVRGRRQGGVSQHDGWIPHI